jgi:hypothetical protein
LCESLKEEMAMWKVVLVALLVGLLAIAAACSARTKLALEETQKNGAHFATWNHLGYSVIRGTPKSTTKRDVEVSKADQCLPNQKCSWWGELVEVQPIQ